MSGEPIIFTQWKAACMAFDFGKRDSINSLVMMLESIARVLAQHEEDRIRLGAIPFLWPDLRKLWRDLARTQLTFWDGDDSEGEDEGSSKDKQRDLRAICGSLAKFTRNLVAGVTTNQNHAFENEPDIRRLLHYHTSWSAMEDSESIPVARTLAQALSNIVTTNELLLGKLWGTYMSLPEDQFVLIRLLASPDPHTLLTALIFVLNCVHGSKQRSKLMVKTSIGARLCISLLDSMVKLYDAEESSEGAQAFDVGYDILTQLIECGLIPDLYYKFTIQDEIITPHQTTLLKIVDSYLQSIQMSAATTPKTIKIHRKLSPMLARIFFALSGYAQEAVERALRPTSSISSNQLNSTSMLESVVETASTKPPPPPAELDVMLPKVCEALVLVTQCIVTIAIEADEQRSSRDQNVPLSDFEPDLKEFFNEARSSECGIVECLIELLRLFDLFLPRINFGKPVVSTSGMTTPTQQSTPDNTGFMYVKRDLVRLLGILCHGVKAVQDRARESGGIEVVMSLCVVDERNPYLREHAIFTLRNLLKDNLENQAVVEGIKPSEDWNKSEVLKYTPGTAHM
ncbi:spinocerebellar ataxia type 10 protein domain-containing protein [Collybia nuda]|uniref:Ataxin-10 homolog n=1 Tax=Collybia nuda TaxID=64659 RepID=A0A9P5Y591_9AGAR|nr:spinocerebellar ataxia type 10 protein domain-containing protein [Collybia nuda]